MIREISYNPFEPSQEMLELIKEDPWYWFIDKYKIIQTRVLRSIQKEVLKDISYLLYEKYWKKDLFDNLWEEVEKYYKDWIVLDFFEEIQLCIKEICKNWFDSIVDNNRNRWEDYKWNIRVRWKINVENETITFFVKDNWAWVNSSSTEYKKNNKKKYSWWSWIGEKILKLKTIKHRRVSSTNWSVVVAKLSLRDIRKDLLWLSKK